MIELFLGYYFVFYCYKCLKLLIIQLKLKINEINVRFEKNDIFN